MLELNFSCPHMTVEGSGHKVGQAFHLLEKFTATVKKAVKIPVLAKMTPNITDMTEPAIFAKKGGADGISAVNTFRAISGIGLDDLVPKPNVFGVGAMSGYSGSAIKPIALHFIAEMAQCEELDLPLSAMGGIETWVDALEYLLVGATTLQVTTGIIHYGYRIVEDMIEGHHRLHGLPRDHQHGGPHRQEPAEPQGHGSLRPEAPGRREVRPGEVRGLRAVLHRLPRRRRPGPGVGRGEAAAEAGSRTSASAA